MSTPDDETRGCYEMILDLVIFAGMSTLLFAVPFGLITGVAAGTGRFEAKLFLMGTAACIAIGGVLFGLGTTLLKRLWRRQGKLPIRDNPE